VWKIPSTLWPHAKRVWMTAKDEIMQETSWHTNRRYTNKKTTRTLKERKEF
jgi:hypothetical protein